MINNNFLITLIGALTSKPYAFTARSWELKNTETIDLFDSICSNIRIDTRGSEIMRILPINNEELNEEWISDKTRFAYDGLKRKRFINPMIKEQNLFRQTSWKNILTILEKKFDNKIFSKFIIESGNFNDLEHLTSIDNLRNITSNIIINPNKYINADLQTYYTINKSFLKEVGPKIYILIGINLRLENPILNIKFKKLSQTNSILVGYIGSKYNYNINLLHLGNNLSILIEILKGKHKFSTIAQNFLKKNNINLKINNSFKNNIYIIFGNEFNQIKNKEKIIAIIEQYKKLSLKFELGILQLYTGIINKFELGLFDNYNHIINNNEPYLYYLLNNESTKNIKNNDFVIFQGTHNEKMRAKFDIILPSSNWTEKTALYLNCFGIIQKTQKVISSPVNVRSDWQITQILKLWLNKNKEELNANSNNILNGLHKRLNELSPNLMNSISNYTINENQNLKIKYKLNFIQKFKNTFITFKPLISNYYQLNSIDKNSKVMINCSKLINTKKNNFYKA